MRSLLRASWSVMLPAVIAFPAAQGQGTTAEQPREASLSAAAVRALVANRPSEARAILQTAVARDLTREQRAVYRLQAAQSFLFESRYTEAAAAFGAVLASEDVKGVDTLTGWALHGIAVAEALAGRTARARALYGQLLRGAAPSTLAVADSIEAYVLTGQRSAANDLLESFGSTRPGTLAQQYVHAFRALQLLLAAACRDALVEISRAPDPGRPLPQAIRGRCAMKDGRHIEAIALRDSVLGEPLADPFSWPMIIARGIARKIN